MNVLQAAAMLKKIHQEVGNVQVCFLVPMGEGYGFDFPDAVAPIGMPNEDETAETTVCAFLQDDIVHEMDQDSDTDQYDRPPSPVRAVDEPEPEREITTDDDETYVAITVKEYQEFHRMKKVAQVERVMKTIVGFMLILCAFLFLVAWGYTTASSYFKPASLTTPANHARSDNGTSVQRERLRSEE